MWWQLALLRQAATDEIRVLDVVDQRYLYRCRQCGYSGIACVIAAGSASTLADADTHAEAREAAAEGAQQAADNQAARLVERTPCPRCGHPTSRARLARVLALGRVALTTLSGLALAVTLTIWQAPLIGLFALLGALALSWVSWQRFHRETVLALGAVTFADTTDEPAEH
ncbi:MAG: hypothetical protein U0271_20335 [Polyangiaceae bacterium]